MKSNQINAWLSLVILALVLGYGAQAQTFDASQFQEMKWRNIGPFRGGRSVAITGIPTKPLTFFVGYTGGGLWKTDDGGLSYQNISDGSFTSSSVGAIAVADSDPNVIYVGMGEAAIRGVMTIHGDGVYKSTDGGDTWKHMGLEKTRQISRVRIHPNNSDLVYVAAQGSPYGANKERGIYRSKDGGKTWELVLYVDENTGASDLSMDVTNPRILYAAFWEHRRYPWIAESGGKNSAIYKSMDGGDTWVKLTNGLPSFMGKIGVAVSPANPKRVWAIVEAEDGGLFRSDDGGKSWSNINKERVLRARSWYYMHIYADPVDENRVYVLNAPFMKSIDGGRTFTNVPTPHGDNHDLWINPLQPTIWANANDGGGNISFDAGRTWSSQQNQPTAQIYRVNVDHKFPYTVYGGQQDNSTIAIPSAANGAGIPWGAFYPVGGCESAFVAFNPENPQFIYAGCYQGIISEWDASTQNTRDIMAYPFLGLGSQPLDQKYRFNWNAPIVVSKFNPNVVYHAGNQVLKTTNRGKTWEEVSPDLTRNDPKYLGYGGGPITREGAGGEIYQTIYYLLESPHSPDVLWAGTDDGLVHVTTDGGKTWKNVTPQGITKTSLINSIEVSLHDANTVYMAVTDYKTNDFTPYVYKTTNGGQSWQKITNGIKAEHWARVVREDPARKDLLYLGTESGFYISFNGGQKWEHLNNNLPLVPVTDLIVYNNDLIAATAGRAFWILDDLTPFHQYSEAVSRADVHLYKPRTAIMTPFGYNPRAGERALGVNPPSGVSAFYTLKQAPAEDKELKIEIISASGKVVRTFSTKGKGPDKINARKGMNRLLWNFDIPPVEGPEGLLAGFGRGGYRVAPGIYTIKLSYGDIVQNQTVEVKPDPRVNLSQAEYQEQEALAEQLQESLKQLYARVNDLRDIRTQVQMMVRRVQDDPQMAAVVEMSRKLVEDINELELILVQPKQETFQDVINFENKLDNHFIHLINTIGGGEPPVTDGQKNRLQDIQKEWEVAKQKINTFIDNDLKAYNDKLSASGLQNIGPKNPNTGQR
jgi:photosystem II stability/assembly factor-like uncharacterized protein